MNCTVAAVGESLGRCQGPETRVRRDYMAAAVVGFSPGRLVAIGLPSGGEPLWTNVPCPISLPKSHPTE